MISTLHRHEPRANGAINQRSLRRIVESPSGRAFLLNFMAELEVSDEGMVFDRLVERVTDPELGRLARIHRDDEKRHNKMLLECLAKLGVEPSPVPADLRIAQRIDELVGGFINDFLDDRGTVMEAYVLLLVLEERAVERYPAIARAFDAVDKETADVVRRVHKDEERHARYARAISRKYAPDPETLERTIARYRVAEHRAFLEGGAAVLRHVLEGDRMNVHGLERLFWHGMLKLSELSVRAAPTPEPRPAPAIAVAA